MSRRSSPSTRRLRETTRTVVGVHGSPKPPPTRISLTLPAIRAAREVWLLAAGEDKAGAVALALSAPGRAAGPGVRVRTGAARTLWLLDRAAASKLPADLYPAGVLVGALLAVRRTRRGRG